MEDVSKQVITAWGMKADKKLNDRELGVCVCVREIICNRKVEIVVVEPSEKGVGGYTCNCYM